MSVSCSIAALEESIGKTVKSVATLGQPHLVAGDALLQRITLSFTDGTSLRLVLKTGCISVYFAPNPDTIATEDFLFHYQRLCERYGRHIEGRDNQGGPIWSKDYD